MAAAALLAVLVLLGWVGWLLARPLPRWSMLAGALPAEGPPAGAAGEALVAAERKRHLAAPLAAGAAGLACWWVQASVPRLVGLPVLIIPLVVWSVWAAVLALPGRPAAPEGGARSADLAVRSARTLGPAWALPLPAFLALLVAACTAVAGMVSGPDESGRLRHLEYAGRGYELDPTGTVVTEVLAGQGSAGPFPGWYYGVPVLVLLVAGCLAGLGAMARVASRPRPADTGLWPLDDVLRTLGAYVITTGSAALLSVQLGVLGLMAAIPLRSASMMDNLQIGDAWSGAATPQGPLAALALAVAGGSVLLVLAGAVLGGLALRGTAELLRPRRAARPAASGSAA